MELALVVTAAFAFRPQPSGPCPRACPHPAELYFAAWRPLLESIPVPHAQPAGQVRKTVLFFFPFSFILCSRRKSAVQLRMTVRDHWTSRVFVKFLARSFTCCSRVFSPNNSMGNCRLLCSIITLRRLALHCPDRSMRPRLTKSFRHMMVPLVEICPRKLFAESFLLEELLICRPCYLLGKQSYKKPTDDIGCCQFVHQWIARTHCWGLKIRVTRPTNCQKLHL